MSKVYYDHLGIPYNSLIELCMDYKISKENFIIRSALKEPLKSILENPNRIITQSELTRYNRLKSKKVKQSVQVVTDHKGICYKDVSSMCCAYHKNPALVKQRLKRGWPLREALEIDNRENRIACRDHKGNQFDTIEKMCKYYGISVEEYTYRRKSYWAKEEALTIPLGQERPNRPNKKPTIKKVNSTSTDRKYKERKPAVPLKEIKAQAEKILKDMIVYDYKGTIVDHKGNKFSSLKQMLSYYNMPRGIFFYRISEGWPLKEALETDPNRGHY